MKRAWSDRLIMDLPVLLLILAWWVSARDLPAYILPGPGVVGMALLRFVTEWPFFLDAVISTARVCTSVTISMLLAVAIALVTSRFPILQPTVERRFLTLLNSFPSVAWAILSLIWFGMTAATVLFIQIAILLPFCLNNALEGVRNLDEDLGELGRSLTRSPLRRFARLTLPLLAPFLVSGLRVGFGIAWKIALVSELFGASSGIGHVMMRAQSTSDVAMMFACCLGIVLISGSTDAWVLRPLGRRFSRNAVGGG